LTTKQRSLRLWLWLIKTKERTTSWLISASSLSTKATKSRTSRLSTNKTIQRSHEAALKREVNFRVLSGELLFLMIY